MSKVVSIRLKDETWQRLQKAARRLGRKPSDASALLLDEALRQDEFAFIQFRNSAVGRQAYVVGTGLAVWEILLVAQSCGGDVDRVSALLDLPTAKVQAAVNYAAAFPSEVEEALSDADKTPEELRRLLPILETHSVSDL